MMPTTFSIFSSILFRPFNYKSHLLEQSQLYEHYTLYVTCELKIFALIRIQDGCSIF